jgi:hypothetical protein
VWSLYVTVAQKDILLPLSGRNIFSLW